MKCPYCAEDLKDKPGPARRRRGHGLHDRAAAREVGDDASIHRELADAGLPRGVTPVFLGVLPADRRPGAQGAHPRPSVLYPPTRRRLGVGELLFRLR